MVENIEDWRKAGKVAGQALEYGRKLIQTDVLLLDVATKIEDKIRELGGKPAFPTNISLNHVAAHDTPAINDPRKFSDEIIKLDVGVNVNGAIGDTACSVDLGDNKDLLKSTQNALNAAIKITGLGVPVCKIGEAIESEITALGFKPIMNLSGHGLKEYELHTGKVIPNYDNGDDTELEAGDVIAIEPFATTGAGKVVDSSNPEIFALISPKPVRSDASRNLIRQCAEFEDLPFCKRWVKMPLFKVNFAIKELCNLNALKEFPPLPDANKGLVSQAEHTLLIGDKTEVLTKVGD